MHPWIRKRRRSSTRVWWKHRRRAAPASRAFPAPDRRVFPCQPSSAPPVESGSASQRPETRLSTPPSPAAPESVRPRGSARRRLPLPGIRDAAAPLRPAASSSAAASVGAADLRRNRQPARRGVGGARTLLHELGDTQREARVLAHQRRPRQASARAREEAGELLCAAQAKFPPGSFSHRLVEEHLRHAKDDVVL